MKKKVAKKLQKLEIYIVKHDSKDL